MLLSADMSHEHHPFLDSPIIKAIGAIGAVKMVVLGLISVAAFVSAWAADQPWWICIIAFSATFAFLTVGAFYAPLAWQKVSGKSDYDFRIFSGESAFSFSVPPKEKTSKGFAWEYPHSPIESVSEISFEINSLGGERHSVEEHHIIDRRPLAERIARPIPLVPEIIEPKKATEEKAPTLVSLMDTSFPRFNKFWGHPLIRFEDGSELQITSALYFDLFTSGTKFLGFHVPSSSRTMQVCSILAEKAIELGDALSNGGLQITSKAPGENPEKHTDLRYSGKVYLSHDDVLTHKQMGEVEEIFKGQQLNVVLRGPDFLSQAWMEWKKTTEGKQ